MFAEITHTPSGDDSDTKISEDRLQSESIRPAQQRSTFEAETTHALFQKCFFAIRLWWMILFLFKMKKAARVCLSDWSRAVKFSKELMVVERRKQFDAAHPQCGFHT